MGRPNPYMFLTPGRPGIYSWGAHTNCVGAKREHHVRYCLILPGVTRCRALVDTPGGNACLMIIALMESYSNTM